MPTERIDLPRLRLRALGEAWNRLDFADRIIFAELLRSSFQVNSTRAPDATIVLASIDRTTRALVKNDGEVTTEMMLTGGE